jgi:hypothetical protein
MADTTPRQCVYASQLTAITIFQAFVSSKFSMSEPLVTYLDDDHLGGADIAIQLLEAMRDQHDNQRFREFAILLLPEIDADDRTLRSVAEKIGAGPSIAKQVGGWLR